MERAPEVEPAPAIERAIATVPLIYTPPVQRQTVDLAARVAALAMAAATLAVLVLAVRLPPSPTGMETHRALGFRRCQMLVVADLPCPTCGMTTSFAHFVRADWLASFRVQPMGFVLALVTGALFWACLYVALTGSPLHRLLRQVPTAQILIAVLTFAIAAWGWKIFLHVRGA